MPRCSVRNTCTKSGSIPSSCPKSSAVEFFSTCRRVRSCREFSGSSSSLERSCLEGFTSMSRARFENRVWCLSACLVSSTATLIRSPAVFNFSGSSMSPCTSTQSTAAIALQNGLLNETRCRGTPWSSERYSNSSWSMECLWSGAFGSTSDRSRGTHNRRMRSGFPVAGSAVSRDSNCAENIFWALRMPFFTDPRGSATVKRSLSKTSMVMD
mmetsp:Transcript_73258/g.195373  ORF Transcript_73258/g.195373 Transcript_73258/m.195373 type:complete len:212 (-) Transcript_73258:888-1523(-)